MSNPASDRNEAAERLREFVAAWRSFNNPSDEVYRVYRGGKEYNLFIDDIAALATERASGGLDVERLQQALATVYHWALPEDDEDAAEELLQAENIAAEYARLTPQPGEEQEIEAALGRRIWPGRLSQPGGSDAEHEKRLARLAADATPQARATLEALGIIAPLDEMQEANREMEADLWNSDR